MRLIYGVQMNGVMLMAMMLFALGSVDSAGAVCTPLGTTTPNLSLCKPNDGESGWTNAINDNWNIVDAAGPTQKGPTATGAGSTQAHEGTVAISTNQNINGVHFYTDFTLNSGVTITVPQGAGGLIIVATRTITINGTINASGAGGLGGSSTFPSGDDGTDQSGGGGSGGSNSYGGDPPELGLIGTPGGNGGSVRIGGALLQRGGSGGMTSPGGAGPGSTATQVTGSRGTRAALVPYLMAGGGGGGKGGDVNFPYNWGCGASSGGGSGGNGGGSIVLVAPSVLLGSTTILNASGTNGSGGGLVCGSYGGSGGGGGAGNIAVSAKNFTNNGATFIQNGGAAGSGGGLSGGAGAAGIKQFFLYQ